MRIAARVALVVIGIVVAQIQVGVDLQHGHVARPPPLGMRPKRPDRHGMGAAQQDHEGLARRQRIGDPRDHVLRRQRADVVQHPLRDPVTVGRLGLGMALEQLDLTVETGEDRARPLARAGAERGAALVGDPDQHRVRRLGRRAVDDRIDHQALSSSLASSRLRRFFQLPL